MNRIELGKVYARAFKMAAIFALLIGMLVPITSVKAGSRTSYSFNFVGPNITMHEGDRIYIEGVMDIQPGSYCIVTGAGTFDTSTLKASGSGVFRHINYDGALYCVGVWKVKEFVSFDGDTLVVMAEFRRVFSPISGYPPMIVGIFPLVISSNGWILPTVFTDIVSGHVHYHAHG
jgi:hypothetical protein